tara:strand:+ start:419 stop:625 length:207 start_codon:yes stop_codon:yes gene_type:complete
MNDNKESKNNKGTIGCLNVLLIILITLKLTNNISWSWWWVLSPLWISLGFACILLSVFGVMLYFNKEK